MRPRDMRLTLIRALGVLVLALMVAVLATAGHARADDAPEAHGGGQSAHVLRKLPGSSLLAVAMRDLGRGKFTAMPGPWCRDALNVWLARIGIRTDGDRRAIAARNIGSPSGPRPGAIAVMRHHVGIVVRVTPGGVEIVSGNHGHHVALGVYPIRRVLAFREV